MTQCAGWRQARPRLAQPVGARTTSGTGGGEAADTAACSELALETETGTAAAGSRREKRTA
eukprot:6200211-Pleurochrysis_carterae.AAC.4